MARTAKNVKHNRGQLNSRLTPVKGPNRLSKSINYSSTVPLGYSNQTKLKTSKTQKKIIMTAAQIHSTFTFCDPCRGCDWRLQWSSRPTVVHSGRHMVDLKGTDDNKRAKNMIYNTCEYFLGRFWVPRTPHKFLKISANKRNMSAYFLPTCAYLNLLKFHKRGNKRQ